MAGAGGMGGVSIASKAGSAVPFVGGGGCRHAAAVAFVLVSGGAGAAEAGPTRVVAVPRGRGARRAPEGGGGMVASWGAEEPGAGASFGV